MADRLTEPTVDARRRPSPGAAALLNETSFLADLPLQQMGDGLMYADETGVIRRWNRAAAALFGYSAAQAIGRTLVLIIPERFRAAHGRGFDAAIEVQQRKAETPKGQI